MADAPGADFPVVALIGTGLIGGSLALAIREAGLCTTIHGFDTDSERAARAQTIGILDQAAPRLEDAVRDADLIIIATPVGAFSTVITGVLQAARADAVIIDVGSVKGNVLTDAEAETRAGHAANSRALIVPCHPIAGTEQSGPDAAFSTLFRDRWCVITPLERDDDAYAHALARVVALWRAIGSQTEIMDAAHHDLALAVTSHLPHLIAFTLIGAADDLETVNEAEIIKYSAGGFRDFTRIAASDPVMWRDVFLHNKAAVLEVLGRFTEELALLQRAIRWGDAATLEESFSRGRALRRAIVAAGQETDAPDFGRHRKDDD